MMICKNCGAVIDEDSRFCGICSAPVTEEKEEASPFASKPIPANMPDRNPTAWIILSVLEILFCLPVIPGVVGLIFGIFAENCRKKQDWEGTASNLKTAKTAVFIGFGIGILGLLISLFGGFLLGLIL